MEEIAICYSSKGKAYLKQDLDTLKRSNNCLGDSTGDTTGDQLFSKQRHTLYDSFPRYCVQEWGKRRGDVSFFEIGEGKGAAWKWGGEGAGSVISVPVPEFLTLSPSPSPSPTDAGNQIPSPLDFGFSPAHPQSLYNTYLKRTVSR
ncbi:hypothetical protein LXL04_002458 [Taraxacum kok-saghyz]